MEKTAVEEDEQLRSQVLKSMVCDSKITGGSSQTPNPACVICLEDISEYAKTIPCAHAFDLVCIINWLERNPTCPLCKSRVLTVEYDRTSWQDAKVYSVEPVQQVPSLSVADEARSRTRNDNQSYRSQLVQQQQQQSPEGHASRSSTVSVDPLDYRKHIYRHQLYSLHVGSNRFSHFQELTPRRFAQDSELVSRARKWIRRELRVFDFLVSPGQADDSREHTNSQVPNAEFLLEWTIAMLKSVDIKGSTGQAEDMLQEVLGRDNTRLFLHELRAWLRSPYLALRDWDCNVQYDETPESLQCFASRVQMRGTKRRRGSDADRHALHPDRRLMRGRAG